MNRTLLLAGLCLSLIASSLPCQRGGGPVKSGPWTKEKIPDGWVVHETKNYQVQSQAGMEKAVRLGEHMEVMNRVYRSMFRPDKDGAKRQVIKLLSDRNAYLQYGAPPSSAAYFSRSEREMVCYDTGKWSDEAPKAEGALTGPDAGSGIRAKLERRLRRMNDMMKMDILGCAAHEGWHQYFDWLVVSFVTLPSWINEGMGDYFYTAAPKEVRGKKMPAELGRLNDGRLMVLKAAILQDRFVPLERLLNMSKEEFYNDGDVCYAEGWAFCQFLLHSGEPKYTKFIANFVKLVRNDSNMEAVTKRVFKGVDLAAMEAEFKEWIGTLKFDGEGETLDDILGEDEGEPMPPEGGEPTPVPPAPPEGSGGTPPGGGGQPGG